MRHAAALAVGAGAGALALAWLATRDQAQADAPPTTETTDGQPEAAQELDTLAPVWAMWDQARETIMPTDTDQADANVAAFLAMIRTAEGTADGLGYRALFGHTAARPRVFEGFADHPRIAQQFTDQAGRTLWTSAAGAYQFMAVSPIPTGGQTRVDTWDRLKRRLALPDFSPASQDAAAVELIREAGALGDVKAGRFEQAVQAVRKVWASMPGAGYSQGERSIDALRWAFVNAGGIVA